MRWAGMNNKAEPIGRRPTPYLLAVLASVYDSAVTDLIDRHPMPPADFRSPRPLASLTFRRL
jgi:hypothetical protein